MDTWTRRERSETLFVRIWPQLPSTELPQCWKVYLLLCKKPPQIRHRSGGQGVQTCDTLAGFPEVRPLGLVSEAPEGGCLTSVGLWKCIQRGKLCGAMSTECLWGWLH